MKNGVSKGGGGVVSSIVRAAANHKSVLEIPILSLKVLQKGLDGGTAFNLSIDIADIDVSKNIGAVLQTDQAEADKRSHKYGLKSVRHGCST